MFITAESEDLSYDESCSDCKTELSRKRWIVLLLQWLHKCVLHDLQHKSLSHRWLVEIINRYKADICDNDLDRAILCTDDLEPFLTYKYPILRLRNLFEEKDQPRKLFIMTSVLLYHCCISSINGAVESDIIQHLGRHQREMILKFCETLSDMEITVNNVENAIRIACDSVTEPLKKKRVLTPYPSMPAVESAVLDAGLNSDSSKCPSSRSTRHSSLTFKSSVTVLSSSASNIKNTGDSDAEVFDQDNTQGEYSPTLDTAEMVTVKHDKEVRRVAEEEAPRKTTVVHRNDTSSAEDVYPSDCPGTLSDRCSCTECVSPGDCNLPDCRHTCEKKRKKKTECQKEKTNTPVENRNTAWVYMFRMSKLKKTKKMFKSIRINRKFCRMKLPRDKHTWTKIMLVLSLILFIAAFIILLVVFLTPKKPDEKQPSKLNEKPVMRSMPSNSLVTNATNYLGWAWICEENLCRKVYQAKIDSNTYIASSQCILLCSGPQIWPLPIGSTHFSKSIVSISTEKLEYKFKAVQSDVLFQYLAEAFKLFLGDLAKLERLRSFKVPDLASKRMNIVIEVETDSDPRMRLNTDESYYLTTKTDGDKVRIHIKSHSFCGVRHGFETLSQIILLDHSTGSLITLSEANIKDAPSYKYRGLMLDTARNYIPVPDILRTIDGMASVKLNTFHWRISDSASFPLLLPKIPILFEHGAYERSMVYTKEDVVTIVNRSGVRGIRVLIEVAVPGPVGRAWSWSEHATCPKKNDNLTCDNVLCTRLKMEERLFGVLQLIYAEIIEMTGVDDIFHLSDSMFSLSHCYLLLDERESFLEKALEQLRLANNGFMPTMPVIWYTSHLSREHEAKTWERYGVQIYEWPTLTDRLLSRFKVIHSSKWDLSCEVKKQRCIRYRSWQEMYAWKSFRTIEAYSTEGGEAILWTDLVDSGNLDTHLWPRTAAVAERLWSDIVANRTAKGKVYLRLDNQRRRLLLKGIKVQPIWPSWCSFHPRACFTKIHQVSSKK